MTRPIVIITTRLPPAMCGVGTYSAMLRKHAANSHTPVFFLVVAEADHADALGARDTIIEFGGNGRRLQEELSRIGAAEVLLHYAARAYHRFGCPTWLPRVLASWKRAFPESTLTVFFHELPGQLPITSRHFWLNLMNTRIIRRLATIADAIVTNTEGHGRELERISGRGDATLLPVASNIQPIAASDVRREGDEFVLFGLPFGRLQTLRAFESHIQSWVEQGRMRKLHLVGPSDDKFSAEADALIARWPDASIIERHGMLPPAQVSMQLSRARFALTNVTPETWSKSGAFMAAAAHGCAVVRTGAPSHSAPLSYTVTAEEVADVSAEDLDRKTAALAQWYYANADWPVIAQKLAAASRSHPRA